MSLNYSKTIADILTKIKQNKEFDGKELEALSELLLKYSQIEVVRLGIHVLNDEKIINNEVFNKFISLVEEFSSQSGIKCFFFPNNNNINEIINLIDSSLISIKLCLFLITNNLLSDALIRASSRGVLIELIVEDSQIDGMGCDVKKLMENGIQVKTDYKDDALMHHKYCIIDNKILITGSFNWTVKAVNKNYENIIILRNNKAITEFNNNFDSLWEIFFNLNDKAKSVEYWNNKKLEEKKEKERIKNNNKISKKIIKKASKSKPKTKRNKKEIIKESKVIYSKKNSNNKSDFSFGIDNSNTKDINSNMNNKAAFESPARTTKETGFLKNIISSVKKLFN